LVSFRLPRRLVAIVALQALAAPALAQSADQASPKTPASTLPSARQVIDRFVQAIGGREAVMKHASRRAVGTFSMPAQGITGTIDVVAARPDRLLLKISVPGLGEIQTGHDGTIGWLINPMTGPMLLEGKQLDQLRADAEFDAPLHDPSRYKSLETLERVEFEGRPAYKLRVVRVSGDEDVEFYDVETGLQLGSVISRESPMGPIKATNVLADYKAFDGLKIATRQIQRSMGTEQVITIAAVEFGDVDASSVAPPSAIRALIKGDGSRF
jgi:hypothetical protein